MDRQAFKQRMQNLKSYRENNPGKGYWDWKVTAYADGGEVKDDRTDHSIAKPIIPENIERIVNGKPWSQLSAQEQFMNRSGYSNGRPLERGLELVHPEFDILSSVRGVSSTVKGLMDTVIGRKLPTDYAYRRTTANELKDIVDSNSFRSIPDNVNLPTKTFTTASGKTVTFGKKKGNSHGVKAFSAGEPWKATTASGDKANEIIIGIPGDNAKWMTGFHGNYEGPFNFKDINKGTGIAVPFNEQGIADISTKGLKVFGKPSKYFSDRYLAYADGGQTGDPDKERFYQATGRSSSGRPLEEGLKPVFSLEDAANMTPIGDAISAKDAYDAVKNRDWLGAGLAALTVLPFVPSGLRNVKAAARYIPTVNRTEQSLINQALGNISKKRDYLSDIANSRNRVLEDINTIPYRNRAEQADKIFGTNYSETYDLLDDLYQHRYFDLPEVQPKDMVASGRLQAKPFAEERFNKTGVGAEPNEFDLWVNTGMYRDPMQLANHEMNHYTDYIISRNIDTSVNNNMLKQLENSLKQTDATDYYRKGTEQKAYMNQLRTMLKQNGDIQNLDEPVSSTLLKKYLDKMSDSDPIKKMFKQHKNINAYTKWFNAIPLLGTTALGANAYFNNNKNE